MNDLREMIERLKAHSEVLGLIRYGGRHVNDMSPGGDFDLFVILKEAPENVESLHFYVEDIPVDLNLRTLTDLQRESPLTEIDLSLLQGEILYDVTGELAKLIKAAGQRWRSVADVSGLTTHEANFLRFSHQHALDKIRHRLQSNPLMSEFLLASNVYWLVLNYFRLRLMPFPGERRALEWLAEYDAEFHHDLTRFYESRRLEDKFQLSESLSERALEPVGGLWKKHELIAFALPGCENTDLQKHGIALMKKLGLS